VIGICRRGLGPPLKLIATLRLLFPLVTFAVLGCGGNDPPATTTAGTTVSQLTVRIAELQTGIAEYCEERNSGSASAADEEKAADDVRELVRLARTGRSAARDALAEVSIVLRTDCANSVLRRRVDRALRP
jgi:hypothetical protein